MELIYSNNYGAFYKIYAPNTECQLQLVVDCIGVFMSMTDLEKLHHIVAHMKKEGKCGHCGNNPCERIWCHGPFHELSLRTDKHVLKALEDLITGTKFILNIDNTLKNFKIN